MKKIEFIFMTKNNVFYSNIVTVLGIESLPDDKKIVLLDKIAALVEQRVSLRLVQQLDEASYKKFESLAEADRTGFLSQVFPDLESVIREEVVRIKEELAGEIANDEFLNAALAE